MNTPILPGAAETLARRMERSKPVSPLQQPDPPARPAKPGRTLPPRAPVRRNAPPDVPVHAPHLPPGSPGTALPLWSFGTGLLLWCPAIGLPPGGLPLQPMDAWMLPGWLVLLTRLRHLPGPLLWVLGPAVAALALSWITMGGQGLILGWTLGFALPFVALSALIAADPTARGRLLLGFIAGAAASALLFLAQILWGAEMLDFRSNPAFSLPPHYGRGFALMPEVSTYSVHALAALGVALVLGLHRGLRADQRYALRALALLLGVTLLFTRSSSVLLMLPVLVMLAVTLTRRFDRNSVILAGLCALLVALALWGFANFFYAERLSNSAAGRSAAMRLASILGGLSPLTSGEIFGLGIGENAAVARRAFEAAQRYGLNFGSLPQGVNSQIIGRLFEEGWPALLHLGMAAALLLRARPTLTTAGSRAIFLMAVASLLMALFVVGYRGIYTNWLWLGLTAGLLAHPSRPS